MIYVGVKKTNNTRAPEGLLPDQVLYVANAASFFHCYDGSRHEYLMKADNYMGENDNSMVIYALYWLINDRKSASQKYLKYVCEDLCSYNLKSIGMEIGTHPGGTKMVPSVG